MLTYQVGPGAGYFATIVYVGDERSRATLTALGNSVRYLPCLTSQGEGVAQSRRHGLSAPRDSP